jgi:hypothetical protein
MSAAAQLWTLPDGLTPDMLRAAALLEQGWPIAPRPMPCAVCGLEAGRHLAALPEGCTGWVHDPADALALAAADAQDRDVMDDLVEAGDRDYVPSGRSGPRVSDYGSCGRAVWYRQQDPKPAGYLPAFVDWRRAALGRIIHDAAAAARSVRYPWRRYEFEIPIPGLDKRGKVDEYDPVTGEVIDDKTCGDPKWAMVGDDGPTEDAWGQAFIYGYALDELGWPVRTITIIAIHRATGQEEHFTRPYDPGFARAALDELVTLAMTLEMGIVPDRVSYGPSGFPCSWCEHRDHCWNRAAAEAAGRSPRSYTLLGAAPTDEVIEWAAREEYAARKTATAADKAKDQAKELLEGLRPGRYGDMIIADRRRTMPKYKDGYNDAVVMLGLPQVFRPDEVPLPTRQDRWIEARPVRKSDLEKERKAKASQE